MKPFRGSSGNRAAVFSGSHENRPDHGFLAIQRSSAGSQIAPDGDRRDIADPDRNAFASCDDGVFDIFDTAKPRIDAGEQRFTGPFDKIGAFGQIGRFQRLNQRVERQTISGQPRGIGLNQVLLFESPDGVHPRNAIDRSHERCDHPVLHCTKIGGLGNIAAQTIAAFGDEAAVPLPTGCATDGCALTAGILVLDRVHEHFAEAGGNRPHDRFRTFGKRGGDGCQPFIHLLAREIDVGTLLEDGGDLAEAVARNRTGHFETVDTGQARFDRIRHLGLHLRRRKGRSLGIDLHLDVRDVGNGIDRQAQKVERAPDGDPDRQDDHHPAETDRYIEDHANQAMTMLLFEVLALGWIISDHVRRSLSRARL